MEAKTPAAACAGPQAPVQLNSAIHITDRPCHTYCHWFRVCVCFHRMTSTFHYVFTSFLCAFHYKKILPNWQPVTQIFVKKMNFQFRKFLPVNNDKSRRIWAGSVHEHSVISLLLLRYWLCVFYSVLWNENPRKHKVSWGYNTSWIKLWKGTHQYVYRS